MAVLANQHDAAVGRQRRNRERSGMEDELDVAPHRSIGHIARILD